MNIIVQTNLDVFCETWPEFDHVPQIGSRVVSIKGSTHLVLKVVGVTYYPKKDGSYNEVCAIVELGLTSQWTCVKDFNDWYERFR